MTRSARTRDLAYSYLEIRRVVGILGMILPVALILVGNWFYQIPFQSNISNYYHTSQRDVFVGIITAIGVVLFCYRGQDQLEQCAAYLASVSALGIALLPVDSNVEPLEQQTWHGWLHVLCGSVFFVTLSAFALYFFPRRPAGQSMTRRRRQRHASYYSCGIALSFFNFLMVIFIIMPDSSLKDWLSKSSLFLWLECGAIWSFSLSWLVKGQALFADITN